MKVVRKKTTARTAVVRERKIGRAARAEQAPRGAAAEGGAHVGALAVLEKHETDDAQRDDDIDDENQGEPEIHVSSFQIMFRMRSSGARPRRSR
jgi:hypothetical protein